MVKKLMKHKWNETEVNSYFLVHCTKNNAIKRESTLRNAVEVDQIKDIINKMDIIEKEEAQDISKIQRRHTYATIVKQKQDFPASVRNERLNSMQRRMPRKEVYQKKIICWSCQREGHIMRNRPNRQVKCYACKEHGHVRQECPNITCSGCKKRGHFSYQCVTTLSSGNISKSS